MESRKFDRSKLRGRMAEKGISQRKMAATMGITLQSLSRKMSNKTRFSTDDIIQISEILGIEPEEIGRYFFTQTV